MLFRRLFNIKMFTLFYKLKIKNFKKKIFLILFLISNLSYAKSYSQTQNTFSTGSSNRLSISLSNTMGVQTSADGNSNLEINNEATLIIDPSSSNLKTKGSNQNKIGKKGSVSFGFFNYLITISILSIFFVGILNFERSRLSRKFPFLEPYIEGFFETLNNFKIIFIDFITSY